MGKDLKAENLAISLPNHGCNKNCPYCVSRMTGYIENNYQLMLRNIEKVKNVARAAEVTSVLFTGKGEPLLCPELAQLANRLRDFPLEIQTNGLLLNSIDKIEFLEQIGINVVAISVDSMADLNSLELAIWQLSIRGMVPRVTLNLIDSMCSEPINELLNKLINMEVRQVTFRRVVAPENPKHAKTAEWIKKNATLEAYNNFISSLHEVMRQDGRSKLIRTLNNGMQVWDIEGLAVLISEYCIQEKNNGDDVRSLVFLEDGHLYTSWNSKASILF